MGARRSHTRRNRPEVHCRHLRHQGGRFLFGAGGGQRSDVQNRRQGSPRTSLAHFAAVGRIGVAGGYACHGRVVVRGCDRGKSHRRAHLPVGTACLVHRGGSIQLRVGSFVAYGCNRVRAHLVGVRSTERLFAAAQQLACVPYRRGVAGACGAVVRAACCAEKEQETQRQDFRLIYATTGALTVAIAAATNKNNSTKGEAALVRQ